MVAEGEGAAALRFPTPLSEVSARRAFLAVVLGLLRSTRIRPIQEIVRRHHV